MTTDQYNQLLSEIYGSNRYFRVSYDVFKVLRLEDGLFYSFLMNLDFLARRKPDKYEGWIYCTFKRMKKHFPHLDDRTENRMVNRLVAKGYLSMSRSRTTPPRRQFTIHYDVFRRDVCSDQIRQIDGFESVNLTGSLNTETTSLRSVEIQRPTPVPLTRDRESVDISDKIYGEQLREIVRKNYPLHAKHHRVTPYYQMFHKLRKSKSDQEIDQVLDFLSKYGKDKYVPIVRTADTFKTKYQAVLEAIKRKKEDARSKGHTGLEEMPPEVKDLYEEIKSHSWSKRDKPFLHQFLCASYSTYSDFVARLKSYVETKAAQILAVKKDRWSDYKVKSGRVPGSLTYADGILQNIPSVRSFVRGWAREASEITQTGKWEGQLNKLSFTSVDQERFTRYLDHSIPGIAEDEKWTELKETLYAV